MECFGEGTRSGISAYAGSHNLADITTAEGAGAVIEQLLSLPPGSTGVTVSAPELGMAPDLSKAEGAKQYLHIPAQNEHPFRFIVNTCSGRT